MRLNWEIGTSKACLTSLHAIGLRLENNDLFPRWMRYFSIARMRASRPHCCHCCELFTCNYGNAIINSKYVMRDASAPLRRLRGCRWVDIFLWGVGLPCLCIYRCNTITEILSITRPDPVSSLCDSIWRNPREYEIAADFNCSTRVMHYLIHVIRAPGGIVAQVWRHLI